LARLQHGAGRSNQHNDRNIHFWQPQVRFVVSLRLTSLSGSAPGPVLRVRRVKNGTLIRAIDLRKIDRHSIASVATLVLGLWQSRRR
jgi:hypothetical protein